MSCDQSAGFPLLNTLLFLPHFKDTFGDTVPVYWLIGSELFSGQNRQIMLDLSEKMQNFYRKSRPQPNEPFTTSVTTESLLSRPRIYTLCMDSGMRAFQLSSAPCCTANHMPLDGIPIGNICNAFCVYCIHY